MKKLISLLALTTIGLTSPAIEFRVSYSLPKISDYKNKTNIDKNTLFNNTSNDKKFMSAVTINYEFDLTIVKTLFDSKGNCWLLSLIFLNTNQLYFIPTGSTTPQKIEGISGDIQIFLDLQNNCWITIRGGGVYFIPAGSTTAQKIEGITVIDQCYIHADPKGNIWIQNYNDNLYFIPAGSTTPQKIMNFDSSEKNELWFDKSNNLWLEMWNKNKQEESLFFLPERSKKPKLITNFNSGFDLFDKNYNAWFYSQKELYFIPAGSTTPQKIQNTYSSIAPETTYVQKIKTDTKNNTWITTSYGWLYFIPAGSTTAQDTQVELTNEIYIDSKDNLWFLKGNNHEFYFIPAGSTTPQKVEEITYGNKYTQDKLGNIWIQDYDGQQNYQLYVFSNGSTTPRKILNINQKIGSNIIFDLQNNCFFAKDSGGVYFIPAGSTTAQKIINSVGVENLQFDNFDNLWYWGGLKGSKFGPKLGTLQSYSSWIKTNISLKTDFSENIMWLNPDQLVSKGVVNLKTTDQEINWIKIIGKATYAPVNHDYNIILNDITDKNHNYSIEINATIFDQTYNINFVLSSLLSKPILNVEQIASNNKTLKSTWFQKQPNIDFKKPSPISEAFVANSAVLLSLPNPTESTTEAATIYGLNSDFSKTGQSEEVTKNLQINGNELGAINGLFEVDITDSASNSFSYYLQVANNPTITNFFTTAQGKYFTHWANHNSYDDKYFTNLQKIDDSATMNTIINDSQTWIPLATYQEYADNIEAIFANFKINNSKTGLTQEEVTSSILTQVGNTVSIQGEDTTDFTKANLKINIAPPKNGQTYQDNEQVTYNVSYNNTPSTNTNSIVINPYIAPPTPSPTPQTKYNYTWVIILVVCLAVVGLAYILWRLWLKKIILNKKMIKENERDQQQIRDMEEINND